jgi:hypothetical protein
MLLSRRLLPRLIPIWLCWAASCGATDYYVSARYGTDTNAGRSLGSAWKTVDRVNHSALLPGDRVLFHAGEVWGEELRPSSSGTSKQRITFSRYGKGALPVLEGDQNVALVEAPENPRQASPMQTAKIAIDNNGQSHVVYEKLELRHVLQGLRVYVWAGSVEDITIRNCRIQTQRKTDRELCSAAIYANVKSGRIAGLRIIGNTVIPFPKGLEHWGIYLVGGVTNFEIRRNSVGPAGEDGVTIWHSSRGSIRGNRGGGNGENTIDVKDSHDVTIVGNRADKDREYNIVVHGVDSVNSTYRIGVEHNRCSRGGQGGELSAGIALLFTHASMVAYNLIDKPFGAGILIKDSGSGAENSVKRNTVIGLKKGRRMPAVLRQEASIRSLYRSQGIPAGQP